MRRFPYAAGVSFGISTVLFLVLLSYLLLAIFVVVAVEVLFHRIFFPVLKFLKIFASVLFSLFFQFDFLLFLFALALYAEAFSLLRLSYYFLLLIFMPIQEHPDLSKTEKKKICSLMDCKMLSPDACMHAVQNDRLPFRVVVHVLFFEQVRQSVLARGAQSLVTQENGAASCGSLRSAMAMANTRDEWDGVPTAADISSLKAMKLVHQG